MNQHTFRFKIQTTGNGFTDITTRVRTRLRDICAYSGLVTVFIRHTSASLLIQENADPDVRRDLTDFFERIAPWTRGLYYHDTEGPDDMPAHIRAALTQTHLSIPVTDGAMVLGTWQGIYLIEHRANGHEREVVCHFMGDVAAQ